MTMRIDPLGLLEPRAETAGSDGVSKVQGRVDLNDTSTCPVCKKQMAPILAADIPSFICWDHRVVLPQQDPAASEPMIVTSAADLPGTLEDAQ